VHTYQIDLTLQVDAVNERAAQRLVRLVGKDIEHGQRRAACPGASGVTRAWMDLYPREIDRPSPTIGWCHHCGRDIARIQDHAPDCAASDYGPDHPEIAPLPPCVLCGGSLDDHWLGSCPDVDLDVIRWEGEGGAACAA
jgi:hypothetical protein